MTLSGCYKAVVVALFFTYGALLSWRPMGCAIDLWAHAAVGSWIWEHGTVPSETLFLWTGSIPWVYHSWLSQLAFFALVSVPCQSTAILLFTVVVGLAPFALVVWAWEGRETAWVAVPGAWMLAAMITRILPRPEIFTSLGLTVLLLLLTRFPGRASRWWVTGFAALFALWANFHGAVVSGLLFLATTVVCDAVQDRDWRRTRALGALFLVALAAVHLNPYGFRYWQALSSVGSYTFSLLSEWKPVWEKPELRQFEVLGAATAAALAGAAWALSPRRRLAQFAWLVLATALFLTARRNVSVLVLVSAVVTAVNAKSLDGQRLWNALAALVRPAAPQPIPPFLAWAFRGAVLTYLVTEVSVLAFFPAEKFDPKPDLGDGAVVFLQRHPLQGRVLTDMENSAYFHWRFGASLPLFIDGMNAYPDQLMRDYMTVLGGDRAAHTLIDAYDINVIILTVHRLGSLAALANNLDRDRDWARVYADGDAVIWVRRRDFAPLVERVGPVSPVSFTTLEMWRPAPP